MLNFYPPFMGSGIRIDHMSADLREIKVRLKLTFWNRNYVKTQFGGALFMMTDPFLMIMLMENLGSEYVVWDKSSQIDFLKPGRSDVFASFNIDQALIDDIIVQTKNHQKYEPIFEIPIYDINGNLISLVKKTIYIRRKKS